MKFLFLTQPCRWLVCVIAVFVANECLAQTRPSIRVATFNVALNRPEAGALQKELSTRDSKQAQAVAEIIQRNRPQILLLNEFDFDEQQTGIENFRKNYLSVSQNGAAPIEYPYRFSAAVNTGVPTGMDLDNNGKTDDPADSFGFGRFPGQYGMVVLSEFPIRSQDVRTFQKFLWNKLPAAKKPIDPKTGQPFYSASEWARLRLSSKSHWDIPIECSGGVLHFLVCHPTPPAFDGPERRNQLRNHDEIKFWADYIAPETSAALSDDKGQAGGLKPGSRFVIAGDLNADPADGSSEGHAIRQLLDHPLIQSNTPASAGGVIAAARQGKANTTQKGPARYDTGDFSDDRVGNLRVDYVLPSRFGLETVKTGVYWPRVEQQRDLVERASDHRMVWIDLRIPMTQ